MDTKRKAILYALAACLIWGTVYVAIKVGLNHGMKPLTFAGVRFLAGGLILLAITLANVNRRKHLNGAPGVSRPTKDKPAFTWKDFRVLALFGLFQTGIQNALFFTGVKLTNAGLASIFINTQPFFVILMAPLFFKDSKITPLRLLGTVIGFGGVAYTAAGEGIAADGRGLGILILVVSAITWGGCNIAAKKLMYGRDVVTVTGVQMAAGAVPLLIAGIIFEGGFMAGVDSTGWMTLAYLVVFATSIPFYLWFKALDTGEIGSVSVFSFTLPVLGVLSGCLLLGESASANILIGMGLVAGGIIAVNVR